MEPSALDERIDLWDDRACDRNRVAERFPELFEHRLQHERLREEVVVDPIFLKSKIRRNYRFLYCGALLLGILGLAFGPDGRGPVAATCLGCIAALFYFLSVFTIRRIIPRQCWTICLENGNVRLLDWRGIETAHARFRDCDWEFSNLSQAMQNYPKQSCIALYLPKKYLGVMGTRLVLCGCTPEYFQIWHQLLEASAPPADA